MENPLPVGNALQHGVVKAPVRVTLRDEGAEVLLEVTNPGKPIAPEIVRAHGGRMGATGTRFEEV